MELVKIGIKNCNCINEGKIEIARNALNIKYGLNGIGKSTIARAIYLDSNDNSLDELRPYGSEDDGELIDNPFKNVKCFNEQYITQYLFEGDKFFDNTYKVFLKDASFEGLKHASSQMLAGLSNSLDAIISHEDFLSYLEQYISITRYSDRGISKTGGMKEVLSGNGSGFENHEELKGYKNFYTDRDFVDVSKWAKWRTDGIKQIHGEDCPFCTHQMNMQNLEVENDVLEKVFKASALKTANEITEFLELGVEKGYIINKQVCVLKSLIGDKDKVDELTAELERLGSESSYLMKKLRAVLDFRPLNINVTDVSNIESIIRNMKVETEYIKTYYLTESIMTMIERVNNSLDVALKRNIELGNLFAKCQNRINDLIIERQEDINEFFKVAGFPYEFKIESRGEDIVESYLVPVAQDSPLESPDKHLSWGEKNAFALVMFMFEAISENPDLIILDDPITSFDKNKKFAIIRRLLDNNKPSFKSKTVLIVTHELQPIIDFVSGSMLRRYDIHIPVYAHYLFNENGILKEQAIEPKSLENIVTLVKDIATNEAYYMSVRIVNLRKHIELTVPNYAEHCGYDVLSNIIHGRTRDNYQKGNTINDDIQDVINKGLEYINNYIDISDYDSFISEVDDSKLFDLVKNEDNHYVKVICLRLIFEKEHSDKNLLKELRKKYPEASKYINETNHIENDYIFQLNPLDFSDIPKYYMEQIEKFLNEEGLS
ncbi:MAG: hypothetical protein SPG03_02100 [Veillonella caviae]|uniref:hypothetical protein n=1 Tax=Veillonella caviae TaxID=248316 RepID=UPI002A91CF40|nr:hypothetical protein [Veillonella caviae]MDY5481170.1 hypothetical protein [Veillonella caviae]